MHWGIRSETLTLIIFVLFRRLKSVMEDDALYASYFWWKDFYQVRTEALDNAQVMMTLNNLHHDHFDKLRRLSLSWHAKGFLWLLFYDSLNSNDANLFNFRPFVISARRFIKTPSPKFIQTFIIGKVHFVIEVVFQPSEWVRVYYRL